MRIHVTIYSIIVFLMSFHSISQCSIKVSVIGRSVQPYVIDEMAPVLFDENQFEQGIDFKEKQSIKIRRLEPGNYQIVYKNRYGKFNRERFKLEKGQKNVNINLSFNKLDSVFYLGKRKIDSLNNGDSLLIFYKSNGCFHHTERTIVFHCRNDELLATQTFDTVIRTVTLDSASIKKIRDFETELEQYHSGGCTTMDMYHVFLNGEEVGACLDNSCSWNGYYTYIAPLFKNEGEE